MTQEALKLALEALMRSRKAVSGNLDLAGCAYGKNDLDGHQYSDAKKALVTLDKAITAIQEALAQPEQEPVAWRTFDGEGGYDYCSYEDNESYADDWNKRNPNHSGWVDKLYTHSQQTWIGLTDEELHQICNSLDYYGDRELVQLIESKLKQKNGFAEEKNNG